MKSKKTSYHKVPNPYDKLNKNPISLRENPSVSQRMRETTSDVSISVDPPAMNIPTNPVNSKILQYLLPPLNLLYQRNMQESMYMQYLVCLHLKVKA